jgi:hypothetical protein
LTTINDVTTTTGCVALRVVPFSVNVVVSVLIEDVEGVDTVDVDADVDEGVTFAAVFVVADDCVPGVGCDCDGVVVGAGVGWGVTGFAVVVVVVVVGVVFDVVVVVVVVVDVVVVVAGCKK